MGITTITRRVIVWESMNDTENNPPIESIGNMETRIIGNIIPRPNISIHGLLRLEL